ncbi:MAG: acyl-CoA thioesterase FadM [Thermoproteota archaeon]|jgi:acyl-CoA thioesterase FadM
MTLYLRLIFLFLKTIIFERKRKFSILEDVTIKLIVLPNDLDLFRHVNNGRFLTLMDLGRFHLLLRSGALKKIATHNFKPTILNAFLNYKKELRLFDVFTLRSKIVYWDDKNFYVKQVFERKNKIVAEGLVKGIIIKGMRKVKPSEFLALLDLKVTRPDKPSYIDHFIDMGDTKISFDS